MLYNLVKLCLHVLVSDKVG